MFAKPAWFTKSCLTEPFLWSHPLHKLRKSCIQSSCLSCLPPHSICFPLLRMYFVVILWLKGDMYPLVCHIKCHIKVQMLHWLIIQPQGSHSLTSTQLPCTFSQKSLELENRNLWLFTLLPKLIYEAQEGHSVHPSTQYTSSFHPNFTLFLFSL